MWCIVRPFKLFSTRENAYRRNGSQVPNTKPARFRALWTICNTGFQGFSQRLSPASSLAMAKWAFLWPLEGWGGGWGGADGCLWGAMGGWGGSRRGFGVQPTCWQRHDSVWWVCGHGRRDAHHHEPHPTLDRLDRSGCMQRMAVGGRGDAFRPFWGRFGLRVVC